MGKTNDWLDFDQLAEEKVRDALKPPSMYKVILVNDDYTPMEFVIDVRTGTQFKYGFRQSARAPS